MATAEEIVSDGLALILVDEANTALEPNELAIGVRFLNDYCAEKFDSGIDFGYRPVSAPDDLVTSQTSVNRALKKILAKELGPVFGIPVSPDVHMGARDAEKQLRANFMRRPRSRMPSIVPMGTGRRGSSTGGRTFYPFSLPIAFLRLDSSETVTISTINTPVQVGGWTIVQTNNVTATAAGAIQVLSETYLSMIEASLTVSAASGDKFTFYVAKNGAILQQSKLEFDADVDQNILVKWPETLRRDDTITLLVENNSDTTNLTITNGHFRIT